MKVHKKQGILSSDQVQKLIEKNLKTVGDLIEQSYGPLGKNILIDRKAIENPELVNNGSTIIKNLRTINEGDNIIFLMLEDSFQKINSITGDGTKTFFLILSYLVLNGFRYLLHNNNALEIRLAIKKTLEYATLILSERSLAIDSKKTWKKVIERYIPTDDDLQYLFDKAFDQIGKSGQLKVVSETGKQTNLSIERGMQIDRGFFSPYFVTDTNKMLIKFENPYVLITNQKITLEDGVLFSLLEPIIYEKKPILLISPDIDEDALSTLVLNKINGIIDIAYVKIPQTFTYDKSVLEDIALYSKANLLTSNYDWKNMQRKDLGQVDRLLITKTKTAFWVDSIEQQEIIKNKCQQLKQQILFSDSDYENEKRENRRKNFSGSTAIISIGGVTDLETNNKRLRTEKGVISAKSCLYEGIIPGSGFSFIHLIEELENWSRTNLYTDYINGSNLVIKSLIKPFEILLSQQATQQNLVPNYLKSLSEIKKSNDVYSIYDPKLAKIVNFIVSGNIDSFKTIKIGLQTASSLAYSILSISNIII